MKTIDIRLNTDARQILGSCIGKSLSSMEHDEFFFTNSSSQAVRLNIDSKKIYIYSFTEQLDYFGSLEDVAVWSVERVELPIIQKKSFIEIPILHAVTDVILVQENQSLFEQETQLYDVWITRGIILELDDLQIAFEKPIWFSEDIIIRRGYDLIETFRPVDEITNANNWLEGTTMKCARFLEKL